MDDKYSNLQLEEIAGGKGELKKGSAALISSLMMLGGAHGLSPQGNKMSLGSGQTISTTDSELPKKRKMNSLKENMKKYLIPTVIASATGALTVGAGVALHKILSDTSNPTSDKMILDILKTTKGTTVAERIFNLLKKNYDKVVFFNDTGLLCAFIGLGSSRWPTVRDLLLSNAEELLNNASEEKQKLIISITKDCVAMQEADVYTCLALPDDKLSTINLIKNYNNQDKLALDIDAVSNFKICYRAKNNEYKSLQEIISENIGKILKNTKLTTKEVQDFIEKHYLSNYFKQTPTEINTQPNQANTLDKNLMNLFRDLIQENNKK